MPETGAAKGSTGAHEPGEAASKAAGGAAGRAADGAAMQAGGRGRRKHPRVVALSEVDRRRLAAGEIASAVDALHQGDAGSLRPSSEPGPGASGESAHDEQLRRDVPPHWGR